MSFASTSDDRSGGSGAIAAASLPSGVGNGPVQLAVRKALSSPFATVERNLRKESCEHAAELTGRQARGWWPRRYALGSAGRAVEAVGGRIEESARMVKEGINVVVTHGNGPQVGIIDEAFEVASKDK